MLNEDLLLPNTDLVVLLIIKPMGWEEDIKPTNNHWDSKEEAGGGIK